MNEPEEDLRLEYQTSGDEWWSAEKWPNLSAAYDLRAGELTRWHDHQSGRGQDGRTWMLVRRLYGISPLVGELTEDDLRVWTREELSARLSISPSIIETELDEAVAAWKQHRAQASVVQASEALTTTEFESLTRFSTSERIGAETIDALLRAFNFDHIKSPSFRAEIADRIISLKAELSVANTRTMAREIIRMEVAMHGLESMLVGYHNQVDALTEKGPTGTTNYKSDLSNCEEKIKGINDQLRQLAKAHSDMMKVLGVEEIDLSAKKKLYVETATYLMEECRKYELDPENWKADSVFTAQEIDWLLTPVPMGVVTREAQYRPDISIRIAEALRPENLWNPDYTPTAIPRRISEELARMVKQCRSFSKTLNPDDEETDIPIDDPDDEGELPGSDLDALPVHEVSASNSSPVFSGPPRAASAKSIGIF